MNEHFLVERTRYLAEENTKLREQLAIANKRINELSGVPGECVSCADPATLKPPHEGRPACQSGSIASGGERSHCSCSICF